MKLSICFITFEDSKKTKILGILLLSLYFCKTENTIITREIEMIDLKKYVLVAAMICCVALNVNAQSLGEEVLEEVLENLENVSVVMIQAICNGKTISDKDTVLKGDTIRFILRWDIDWIKNVVLKIGKKRYKPTFEELEKGEMSFFKIARKTEVLKCIVYFKKLEEVKKRLNVDFDTVTDYVMKQKVKYNIHVIDR